MKKSRSLSPRWTGPYTIIQPLSDVVYLLQTCRGKKGISIHHDRMKPYKSRPVHLTSNEQSKVICQPIGNLQHDMTDPGWDKGSKEWECCSGDVDQPENGSDDDMDQLENDNEDGMGEDHNGDDAVRIQRPVRNRRHPQRYGDYQWILTLILVWTVIKSIRQLS